MRLGASNAAHYNESASLPSLSAALSSFTSGQPMRPTKLRRRLATLLTWSFQTVFAFAALSTVPLPTRADEKQQGKPDDAAAVEFERDVAPILSKKCVKCHSPKKRRAELDVSSLSSFLRGGESGAIVESGDPDESLLIEMIRDELMPPEDETALTEDESATLERWVAGGLKSASKDSHAALNEVVTNQDIEPIMMLRCSFCHGLRTQEGGLDLRTRASMLRGGKSGAAIVLGRPKESLVLKRIHAGDMPPADKLVRAGVRPITAGEIGKLSKWIQTGAPISKVKPDVADSQPDPLVTSEDRQFWAFQTPHPQAVPVVKNSQLPRNPIDNFLLRRLEQRSLSFSPQAAKRVLVRRLYFDLTGLPPSREQVLQFVEDVRPDAYEQLVDRLLASPRYGERWGRIWLDVAGYADSEGKRSADPIRPYAYKYRDYVVRSFNSDKPYSRFLTEQLAGDELQDYSNMDSLTPEIVDNLVATGFLRMAPDGTGSDIVNTVAERIEVIADEIDIFSSSILGLSMKCARCHSHKYDPIPQRDYYRLAAVFKGAFDEHDWLIPAFVAGQSKAVKAGRVLPAGTKAEFQAIAARDTQVETDVANLDQQKKALAQGVRAKFLEEGLRKLPDAIRDDVENALALAPKQRNQVQQFLAKKFSSKLTLTDAQVKKQPGYSRMALVIDRQIKSLRGEKRDGVQVRALWDRGEPSPTYIYVRGDHRQFGRLVGPGVPSVLTDGTTPFVPTPHTAGTPSTGRRLALANWLTNASHPLTARVMVNRIWKHHFGRGIVSSLDNFGNMGVRPTHPQLLDWLAIRFVEGGWSIKAMHRLMLLSTAYRQSSLVSEQHLKQDPENLLLSRMPLRRLDAEQLRDTLIFVAGRLDNQTFGRPGLVTARKDGLMTAQPSGEDAWRRSLYVRQRRKEIPTILETFDLPQMNPNCQTRANSTVAQQALHLMNDPLVRKLGGRFGERVRAESADDVMRIQFAYLTAFGRDPSQQELAASQESLSQLRAATRPKPTSQSGSANDDEAAWTLFCHTLFNAAEFLYID